MTRIIDEESDHNGQSNQPLLRAARRAASPARPERYRAAAWLIGLGLTFAWALWFGGLMTLFLAVEALFTARRSIAPDAASAIFIVFERYELLVCGLTLVFSALLYGLRPSWRLLIAFLLFAAASIMVVYSSMLVTPRMETLRLEYLTRTVEFARLHTISSILFGGQAMFLLIAGILMPGK